MVIIDANTGAQVHWGETFNNINGTFTLLEVTEGLFSAKAMLRNSAGTVITVPLVVRYMHPGFLFRKVGFIPS